MIDWKQWGRRLLFPPLWILIPSALLSSLGLIWVFAGGNDAHPAAYGIYAFSFYTVLVCSVFCVFVLPPRLRALKSTVSSHRLGNRWLTDREFRTRCSLYVTFAVNLLYAAVNALSAIAYHTAWFAIFAGYYTVLACMRFLLLRYFAKSPLGTNLLGEWRRARLCACVLMLINLSLSAAILMMMYQNRGFEYPGILIYVMATYAFYVTVHAVVEIVRYRRLTSPVMTTSKIVSLASALVSMLSLETAMLTEFGGETSLLTKRILIASTGAGISLIILTLSVFLILRSNRVIRTLKQGESNRYE